MIFPLNPRASYALYIFFSIMLCIHIYTISPCLRMLCFHTMLFHHICVCLCIHIVLFHHTFVCLCFHTNAISPYWYVMFPCVHSISPYFRMFMYPNYLHYFTISCVCLCFHIYTISPCILIVRVMYPYKCYFTILICYVSMCSFYFTILSYVYVSKLLTLFHHILCMFMFPHLYYFTVHINRARYVSI